MLTRTNARKKASKRRNKKLSRQYDKAGMIIVTLLVLMIMVVVAVNSHDLQSKIEGKQKESSKLAEQIEDEKARTDEIEELRKQMQTKGYIEDVARDKFGLVYDGEILFKEEK